MIAVGVGVGFGGGKPLKLKEWQYVSIDGNKTYSNYATANTPGFKGVVINNVLNTSYNGADVIAYNHLGLPISKYSSDWGWNTVTEVIRVGFNNTNIYMTVANEYTGFTDVMTPTMQQWKDFFTAHNYQLIYKLSQPVMVPEEVYPDIFKEYEPK